MEGSCSAPLPTPCLPARPPTLVGAHPTLPRRPRACPVSVVTASDDWFPFVFLPPMHCCPMALLCLLFMLMRFTPLAMHLRSLPAN